MGALENGQLDIVDVLYEHDEEWRTGKRSRMFAAVLVESAIRNGDPCVIERVQDAIAPTMKWASSVLLRLICCFHRDVMCEWALEHGVYWSKPNLDYGLFTLTTCMVKRQSDVDARRRGFRMMHVIIQQGASVSAHHDLMFISATQDNDEEMLRFLLQHGQPSTSQSYLYWEHRARDTKVGSIFREYLIEK